MREGSEGKTKNVQNGQIIVKQNRQNFKKPKAKSESTEKLCSRQTFLKKIHALFDRSCWKIQKSAKNYQN